MARRLSFPPTSVAVMVYFLANKPRTLRARVNEVAQGFGLNSCSNQATIAAQQLTTSKASEVTGQQIDLLTVLDASPRLVSPAAAGLGGPPAALSGS